MNIDARYKIYGVGVGPPIVLLHGEDFETILPSLVESCRVIAVQQGTADTVAALLRCLEIKEADIFGYGSGSEIAIELAARYPELVRRLVIVGIPARAQVIDKPALIVMGDCDYSCIAQTLPVLSSHVQLAVLPGIASESIGVQRANWLRSMIWEFLDTPIVREKS